MSRKQREKEAETAGLIESGPIEEQAADMEEEAAIEAQPSATEFDEATKVEPLPIEAAPTEPSWKRGRIVLTAETPLGNGTRPKGFVLGEVRIPPGVDLGEIYCAFCNPQRSSVTIEPE